MFCQKDGGKSYDSRYLLKNINKHLLKNNKEQKLMFNSKQKTESNKSLSKKI